MTIFKNKFNQWLIVSGAFIVAMLVVRFKFTGSVKFVFLLWNLFLAFIPYCVSFYFNKLVTIQRWKRVFIFTLWLLFFPNALYIVTDIIHLRDDETVPIWFDAVLLFSSSFVGLALAFTSMIHTEQLLKQFYSKKKVHFFMLWIIFLGAFGVYLGRFQRWNSWDIVSNPFALVLDVTGRFIHPFSHTYSWGVIFFLTILYTMCWYFIKAIATFRQQ